MSNLHLLFVLQLCGLILMASGALNTPADHAMVIIGGLVAFIGGIAYRRRTRQG